MNGRNDFEEEVEGEKREKRREKVTATFIYKQMWIMSVKDVLLSLLPTLNVKVI